MKIKKLKNLIDKYEYISFDLFDTILKRNVTNPFLIYDIIELNYIENNVKNIKDFSSKRKQIEIDLWNQSEGADLNINNIYSRIDNKSANDILKYEQELESNMICCNTAMLELYNYCILKNKKVIFISDMYHTKNFLQNVLKKNGINGYYKLYISSECKCTKSEGKLFDYVKKDLGTSNILHIGDSLKSDFIVPKLKGLHSYKIKRNINHLNYQKSKENISTLGDDILYSLTNNHIGEIEQTYQKIGYEALGNLLIGFSCWLHNECQKKNIKKILFLSRDGYIMKKAYDILFQNEEIETQYFLASRRSLTVPMLTNITCFDDVLEIVKFRKKETFSSLLKRVGIINLHKEDKIISNLEVDRDKIINDNKLLSKLNKYIDEIKENAQIESDAFIEYFEENISSNHIAVVDIGWHGTMQDCLENLLKKNKIDCLIDGFYIGLSCEQNSNKKSYAFDKNTKKYNSDLISAYRGLIETFFSAYHGSAQKYYVENNKPLVLLEDYNVPKETLEIIKEIHEGAIKNVVDFSKILQYVKNIPITSKYSFSSLYKLMTKPSKKDVKQFENLIFFDMEYRKLVEYKGFKYYITHVKQFIKDFINCDWRIGFLKKTFNVVNISDKIVLIIYKFKK